MTAGPGGGERSLAPGSRVLVVKLSSLGDLFHALPVVHCLKQGGAAAIDWVTQPEYVELVRCFGDVDRVIAFPRRRLLAGFRPFRQELRRERYDLVVDLQGLFKSGWVCSMARASRRLGPSDHREGSRIFYSEVAGPRLPDRHAADRALDAADYLGLSRDCGSVPFRWPSVELGEGRPRVGLVPCSRWPTKNWPPERFVEVGAELQKRARAQLYIFGGPDDTVVCNRIADGIPGSTNVCGTFDLPETAAALAEMDAVVTVDTGPMHMAAAQNVPVVAVFGPTNPRWTGPYGNGHQVVQVSDLDCVPCLSRTCSRGDLACLERISAEDVVDRVVAILPKSL